MATVGLSRPYVAKYSASPEGVVSYSASMILGKAIAFSSSIEASSDNNLYADNGIAESDNTFSNGTFSINTDDLSQEASALILGITPSTVTIGEEEVAELVYNNNTNPPDLGFGAVIKKKKGGAIKWRAVILPKVKFNIPEDAATTQGEAIEWQTPTIEGIIMRDDAEDQNWKREAVLDTELKARAYIEHYLGTPGEE